MIETAVPERGKSSSAGRLVLLGVALILLITCGAAAFYLWSSTPRHEDVASYRIDVKLDRFTKRVTGSETILFKNTSQQAVPDLIFHLYMNAFKDENTLFMKESGLNSGLTYPGWIEVDSIRMAGGPQLKLVLEEDGTLARAVLPVPLEPGKTLELLVSFTVQLPRVHVRSGWASDSAGKPYFLVGQWFPKLGVWQDGAWNAYPYHATSEFFANFGDYDISITLPADYIIGATGLPGQRVDNPDGTQTVSYHAEDVIDFTWAASPNFKTVVRQMEEVEIIYLVLPEHAWTEARVLDAAEQSLIHYGEWYGKYPYKRLTIVDMPTQASALPMEYPMLVTITAPNRWKDETGPVSNRELEVLVSHEIGHQWWQSVVATNEAEEAWLDEGFTEYSSFRLMDQLYPGQKIYLKYGANATILDVLHAEYLVYPRVEVDLPSWEYAGWGEYGVAAYTKPALALRTLEGVLGEEQMLEVMSAYFETYRFDHPTAEDFRRTAEKVSGEDLSWFFDGLVATGETVNYRVKSLDETKVVIERVGEILIPVDVRVEFSTGDVITETWDAPGPSVTYTYPQGGLEQVIIDPRQMIAVDLDFTDNSMKR